MTMDNNASTAYRFSQGIISLFFIQIFSTLSYSVLYSTLLLCMTGPLGLSSQFSNSTMGVFVAFNYALHVLGGYIGGRFLSYRSLFCVGMVAQIIGCFLLSLLDVHYLKFGLAAFLTGAGLNVTCLNCMLTQRFKPQDMRRETAFLYNYAGMNIGFFLGFSLAGYFHLLHNYHHLFLLGTIGNVMALLICGYCWHSLADVNTLFSLRDKASQRRSLYMGLVMVVGLFIALTQLLEFVNFSNQLILLAGVAMLILIYKFAQEQPTREAREKLFALIALLAVGAVFWTLYMLVPMGLTFFIEHNVQRNVGLIKIPPQWFQNINTISIVIGGPLLSYVLTRMRNKGIYINTAIQFAMALMLIGLSIAILPIGIALANENGLVDPLWVFCSFVLQSVGELLISPIGYAMIGALAPTNLQGVMMGICMLFTGVGATLSSYSSNWMTVGQSSVDPLLTNAGYSHVFLMLGLFSLMIGFMLYLVSPKIKSWMVDNKEAKMSDDAAGAVSI